ncbi:GNAT family N-acetyltransferase [Brevibacillus fulvus]|uniref:Ribosomal-protein-serine acetyltransferase n=1 Tax=Brevibacillus fulvus TaxID=1125967 RepID=A0A938Y279_9BACL|nr:GNAT family protein [Brevibacillus fulvus]MBM7591044.1 ribosomal-protein-serine acetyltransferase [Brevibacillus fulvus]
MYMLTIAPDAWLRPLDLQDTLPMFQLIQQNRVHLRQWLGWIEDTETYEDTASFIMMTIRQANNKQGSHFGIWYKGELAGTIGVHGIDWNNRHTTLGYWLGERFQGKGLMTSAVAAYLDEWIFGKWNLHRAEIRAATGNKRSRAIPERLGFQLEGVLRANEFLYDHYVDHAVYGLLADEWKGI